MIVIINRLLCVIVILYRRLALYDANFWIKIKVIVRKWKIFLNNRRKFRLLVPIENSNYFFFSFPISSKKVTFAYLMRDFLNIDISTSC